MDLMKYSRELAKINSIESDASQSREKVLVDLESMTNSHNPNLAIQYTQTKHWKLQSIIRLALGINIVYYIQFPVFELQISVLHDSSNPNPFRDITVYCCQSVNESNPKENFSSRLIQRA